MNARPPLSRTIIAALVCTLAAIVATPRQARAQTATAYTFGVSVGLAVPTGNLSDFTSSHYNTAVPLGIHQAVTPFDLNHEALFIDLPWTDNDLDDHTNHRLYGLEHH